jgi:hypothetical protein
MRCATENLTRRASDAPTPHRIGVIAMSEANPPSFFKGLAGPLLEPYYLVFGETVRCPDCGETWRGYYCQHMNYCHFCGVELAADSRQTGNDTRGE